MSSLNNPSGGAPSGSAGGELTGTYPSPSVAASHSGSAHHTNSNDPTADQKAALAGTGTPSATDKYVNDSDARNTNARTPTAHAASHAVAGGDAVSITHAQTTGQTANDHHAQAHHAAHEPLGADPMAVDAVAGTASLRTLGTGAQQATAGNDSRLSDARTPTAHASTHNSGGGDALAIDAVAATGSLRTLGTGAQQAAAGNDSRLSDSRTPTAHVLDGALHTVSGLTPGNVLKALTATTFGFAAPAAATVALTVTEQNFGTSKVRYKEFAVTDANVLVTSHIKVSLLSEAPAALRDSVAADADEAEMEPMRLWASGIKAGSFTLVADVVDGPVTGPYKFGYLIG